MNIFLKQFLKNENIYIIEVRKNCNIKGLGSSEQQMQNDTAGAHKNIPYKTTYMYIREQSH